MFIWFFMWYYNYAFCRQSSLVSEMLIIVDFDLSDKKWEFSDLFIGRPPAAMETTSALEKIFRKSSQATKLVEE